MNISFNWTTLIFFVILGWGFVSLIGFTHYNGDIASQLLLVVFGVEVMANIVMVLLKKIGGTK